jgi:hypothetical protein
MHGSMFSRSDITFYLTAYELFLDLTTFASRMLIASWHAILVNITLHVRPTDVMVCN